MRKFTCPFCGYKRIFPPKGKSKHKKRVSGFTCPSCGKKVTDDDIKRSKGKGPKPPGERRKRGKKEDIQETNIVPIITLKSQKTETNDIKWRQKDHQYRPPSDARHPSARPRRWQPKRMDVSLGEASQMNSEIVPSGIINIENEQESFKPLDRKINDEEIERATEVLDEARKKLMGTAINLSSIERKLNTKIDAIMERLDRSTQTISTLLSHLENLMDEDRRKRKLAK